MDTKRKFSALLLDGSTIRNTWPPGRLWGIWNASCDSADEFHKIFQLIEVFMTLEAVLKLP